MSDGAFGGLFGSPVETPELRPRDDIEASGDYIGVDLGAERAYLARTALSELARISEKFGLGSDPREVAFLCLGRREQDARGNYTIVEAIPKVSVGTRGFVRLNVADKEAARRRHPVLDVVGWAHTHPGHGLRFSQPDLRNCEDYGPRGVNLLHDPHKGKIAVALAGDILARFPLSSTEAAPEAPEPAPAPALEPAPAPAPVKPMFDAPRVVREPRPSAPLRLPLAPPPQVYTASEPAAARGRLLGGSWIPTGLRGWLTIGLTLAIGLFIFQYLTRPLVTAPAASAPAGASSSVPRQAPPRAAISEALSFDWESLGWSEQPEPSPSRASVRRASGRRASGLCTQNDVTTVRFASAEYKLLGSEIDQIDRFVEGCKSDLTVHIQCLPEDLELLNQAIRGEASVDLVREVNTLARRRGWESRFSAYQDAAPSEEDGDAPARVAMIGCCREVGS